MVRQLLTMPVPSVASLHKFCFAKRNRGRAQALFFVANSVLCLAHGANSVLGCYRNQVVLLRSTPAIFRGAEISGREAKLPDQVAD
jgi:hypothetical protein